MDPPPPPPPPHGSNQQSGKSGGLPPGNYDIFVIPPHSSGSGFLYLPSLHTQRNSFLAGVACTAGAFLIWSALEPVVKEWFNTLIAGGGPGLLILVLAVGVAAWAVGKTQGEGSFPGTAGSGAGGASASGAGTAPQPGPTAGSTHNPTAGATPPPPPPPTSSSAGAAPPPKSSWQRPNPYTAGGATGAAKSSWEKAREETRKKDEERRRAEEAKRRREEAEKERQRQRDKDAKEREERERKTRADQADEERKERQRQQERAKQQEQEREQQKERSIPLRPPHPTARTETEDDAYSFRPYDRPKRNDAKSGSRASTYSESSYAASQTTARTTPPPSHRGPYTTKDPDKIIIKAVYSFNNAFQRTPISQLISGSGSVTNGLILRITTEGLFIDDDVRGVAQREWDVKAWTLKMAESCELSNLLILRTSIRDQEGKKYVFIISQSEGWKVAVGLQRLRRGTQVRALGVTGLPQNETKAIIESLGWG